MTFNISYSILRDRRVEIISQHDVKLKSMKLTQSEKRMIIDHMLNLDLREFSSRLIVVRDITNLLLDERDEKQIKQN